MITDIKIGCCGFTMAQSRYFSTFPVIEVQHTFYQPPRIETLERWRAQAPHDFEFTAKAWQLITHEPTSPTYRKLRAPIPTSKACRYGAFRPTDEVFAAWQETYQCLRALQARIVVFQCPRSFTPTSTNLRNLRAFFSAIKPQTRNLICVWEPRGAWPREQIQALCEELNLLYAVDPFQNSPLPGRLRYFRLHGAADYRYRFSDAELQQLRTWCEATTTYCMFNNIGMADDAVRFARIIGAPLAAPKKVARSARRPRVRPPVQTPLQ